MSITVSNCQHCDKQQLRILSWVHYTTFSVAKLDLFMRTLLLDGILTMEKTTRTPRVHLVYIKVTIFTPFFLNIIFYINFFFFLDTRLIAMR